MHGVTRGADGHAMIVISRIDPHLLHFISLSTSAQPRFLASRLDFDREMRGRTRAPRDRQEPMERDDGHEDGSRRT